MDFYLGLTGLPGTGKEAVSKLITAELAAHDIRTLHYSLSGPITLELQRRGLPPDREQMRAIANEMRANLGNGAWASRIAREIRETLAVSEWTDVFVMIDGVRNPAEIAVFKQLWGSRFHLLAVSAPEEVRRLNLTARSSPKDAAVLGHLADAGADSAAIAPVLTAEMGIGQPQHGTNVLACIELADWTLDNAEHDATLRTLRVAVRSFVDRLVLPLYRQNAPVADVSGSVRTSTVRQGEHAPVADASGSVGAWTVRERPRALVVESDPAWQARLAALLEQESCAVEFAADYAAASRKLLAQPARYPYQLLTVDLHLHAGTANGSEEHVETATGFDLLQSLHYFDRSLPTVVVAAHADPAQVSQAFRDFDVRDYYPKQQFAAQAFRSRVRSILQTPFYVVATLEAGAADYLLLGHPYPLTIRIQRDAPPHKPPLGEARALSRPCTADNWPLAVTVNSPDLRLQLQPGPDQQLTVPANYLAEPLAYTITPLSAGNGRLELEFHQPGQFVDWLAFNVNVRVE
jgi:CheY-like chemotaxis protein/dephospho-CoA kinase